MTQRFASARNDWRSKKNAKTQIGWGDKGEETKYVSTGQKQFVFGRFRTVYECRDGLFVRVLDKETNKYIYKKLN